MPNYPACTQVANTIFGELDAADADVDFDLLEDEFAAKPTQQLGLNKPVADGKRAAPARRMLLPMQRAQNIGVFLTKLKMGPLQVCAVSSFRVQSLGLKGKRRLSVQRAQNIGISLTKAQDAPTAGTPPCLPQDLL